MHPRNNAGVCHRQGLALHFLGFVTFLANLKQGVGDFSPREFRIWHMDAIISAHC